MAEIIFYEKPGCINGEKQKSILKKAGHSLHCINILKHIWTETELLPFVTGKQPDSMMNFTAPAIKNGEIFPSNLSFDEALKMMLAQPILIKRPLIRVDGMAIQGFQDKRLLPYFGDWDGKDDVITCPNINKSSCDNKES